jgi:D-serine deaminase-like pyridoxal phosphate-dependent protein
VLRGGSYLTYDHGMYKKKLRDMVQRGAQKGPGSPFEPVSDFAPALEIWAMVQAMHDPGVAVLTMGIRDLPYDLGYPVPLRQYRDGALVRNVLKDGYEEIGHPRGPVRHHTGSNDQHCYMSYPAGADLRVGGTSSPAASRIPARRSTNGTCCSASTRISP